MSQQINPNREKRVGMNDFSQFSIHITRLSISDEEVVFFCVGNSAWSALSFASANEVMARDFDIKR